MGVACYCAAAPRESNRRPRPGNPADLRMLNFTGKAAFTQMRIAVKILRGLDDRGGDAFALQHHHDLVRRVLCGPGFDPVVELLTIRHSRLGLGKSMVG